VATIERDNIAEDLVAAKPSASRGRAKALARQWGSLTIAPKGIISELPGSPSMYKGELRGLSSLILSLRIMRGKRMRFVIFARRRTHHHSQS